MFSNRISGAVPASVGPTATTGAAATAAHSDRHAAELSHSLNLLAWVADSRPGRYVRSAELVQMADNRHGQYRPDIQYAARVFLGNGAAMARARQAVRQRGANPHSASAGGRAYDFHDLQSIREYLALHPVDERHAGQGQDRQPAFAACAAGFEGGWRPHGFHRLADELLAAVRLLIGEMQHRGRHRMSLERLIAMGLEGLPGASYLYNDVDALVAMIDHEAHRSAAIAVSQLVALLGMPGDQAPGFGNFHGFADVPAGVPPHTASAAWTPSVSVSEPEPSEPPETDADDPDSQLRVQEVIVDRERHIRDHTLQQEYVRMWQKQADLEREQQRIEDVRREQIQNLQTDELRNGSH